MSEERFGMNGSIKYNHYKRLHEDISKKIRRGELPNTTSSFKQLFDTMLSDLRAVCKKGEKFKIKVIISLAILAFFVLGVISSPQMEGGIALIAIGAIPLALVIWGRNRQNKELDAILSFDNEFLDGRVSAMWKSGNYIK